MKPLLIIAFIVLVAAGLIAGRVVAGRREGQTARDIERLADVRDIQTAFERLWLAEKSYASAAASSGCQAGQDVRSCDLPGVAHSRDSWVDPSGGFYVMAEVPTDNGFAVRFQLEAGYDDLAAGGHQVSAQGIE